MVEIEPSQLLQGVKRLSAANLLAREPSPTDGAMDYTARLTSRGEEIAARISDQID